MSSAHPFPSCIDCKIYKGLCALHAGQLGRKAGVQTEPFGSPSIPKSVNPTSLGSSIIISTPPSITIPDKDLESKIRAESAACIDCKIYRTMCGIHASKLKALTSKAVLSPQSARSPSNFYKGASSPGRTMTGKNITRTTSFTGLAAMRKNPLSPSTSDSSLIKSTPPSSSSSPTNLSTHFEQKSKEPPVSKTTQSTPLHDGPTQCPNCHTTRDVDDAIFCGDCRYNYQTGKASDTRSVATTTSNSSTPNSTSTSLETVCKDCGAVRDPADSLFCGECGYRFPASSGEEEVQAF